jgi:hypothetical protein
MAGGSGSSTDAHPAAAEHAGHADDRHEAAKRLVEAITARRKLRGLIGLYPLPCRELGIADG